MNLIKVISNVFTVILLSCGLQACTFKIVRGNGHIVKKEIAVSDYSAIDFSGGASLIYEQKSGEAPYFSVEIDENLFPLLIIESNGTTLSVRNKEHIRSTRYTIYTNSTGLKKLNASGSLKTQLKGKLVTEDLSIRISGRANIQVEELECRTFHSDISGSTSIALAGKANQVHYSVSGSGKLKALPMIADSVFCEISGSGDFEVNAVEYLNVNISGAGKVRYKGNPGIHQSISGLGKVIPVK
jgi:hypothetical protein